MKGKTCLEESLQQKEVWSAQLPDHAMAAARCYQLCLSTLAEDVTGGKSPRSWGWVWHCGNAGNAHVRLYWPQLAVAFVLWHLGLQFCASLGCSCLCFLSFSLPSPNSFLVLTQTLAILSKVALGQGCFYTHPMLHCPVPSAG